MKHSNRILYLTAMVGLTALPAAADVATSEAVSSSAQAWDVSGFGSVGLARSTLSDASYRLAPSYHYGVADAWSSVLDTRVGAQLQYKFNARWQWVAQAVWHRTSNDQMTLDPTWFYLKYQPSAELEILAGRVRHSLFMITDEVDLGFAWLWVRPPVEVYSLVAESNFIDGAKVRYRRYVGDYLLTSEAHYGVMTIDREPRVHIHNRYNTGVALTLAGEAWTARLSAVQAGTELRSNRLDALVQAISNVSPAIAADYQVADLPAQRYINAGVRYEDGAWWGQAEYVRLWLGSRFLPNKQGMYATLGYRFGQWTPYVSVASQQVDMAAAETRLPEPLLSQTNQVLRGLNSAQRSYSLGARVDVWSHASLKFQLDKVHQAADATGLQGVYLSKPQFWVQSMVLDWVF